MKRWYARVETIDGIVSHVLIDDSVGIRFGYANCNKSYFASIDIDVNAIHDLYFPEYRLIDLIVYPVFIEEIEAMPEVI